MAAKKTPLNYTIHSADESQPTGRLLILLFRAFETELIEKLREKGISDVSMSDFNVIRHLDPQGSQISEIARLAGLSKQAIGRTVAELEVKEIVRTTADLEDRRAKRVQFTEKGANLVSTAIEIIIGIEARYKSELGESDYQRLRQLLIILIDNYKSDLA